VTPRIRRARSEEADALTALCIRSKARWGNDAAFMSQVAAALTITPTVIAENGVLVAEGRDCGLLGVAVIAALETAGRFDVSLLSVEPSAINTGVGRALFTAAVSLVEAKGGVSMAILADPFAAAFYRRLGATEIGQAPSDAIAGRLLPLFEYPISRCAGSC
jgi:GNAT superfamily N-acetyltransferase